MTNELQIILGGILLGLSVGSYLLVRGRILGCSGMIFRLASLSKSNMDADTVLFVIGLFLSGVIYNYFFAVPNPNAVFKLSYSTLFIGGLFVGAGTFLGNGCTSGHGLCGLSLMRKRSFIAVGIFFPLAIIVSWIIH